MPDDVSSLTNGPLAWLITFTTYGTWLHGDPRGSHYRARGGLRASGHKPEPKKVQQERARMKEPPFELTDEMRSVALEAMLEVCRYRKWPAIGLNVRRQHVHGELPAMGDDPRRMMGDLKAYATRRLVEAKLVEQGRRIWTRNGHCLPLWTGKAVLMAGIYVIEGQGAGLGTSLMNVDVPLTLEAGIPPCSRRSSCPR